MHLLEKSIKFYINQKFSWAIGNYLFNKYIYHIRLISKYLILDLIILDINIFSLKVENSIENQSN